MKREVEYFTDHSMGSESLRLGDHEILLSFMNDGGAYAFEEWWLKRGQELYENYVFENLKDLYENYG